MSKRKSIIGVLFFFLILLFFGTPLTYGAPLPPTSLTATNNGGPISLSWTAAVGATSYTVYRSTLTITALTDEGVEVAGVSTSTTFMDINTEDTITYRYVTTAWDATGESATFSNEAIVTAFYVTLTVSLSADTQLIDYETNGTPAQSVITYTVDSGYLAQSIAIDIIDNYSDSSIFKEPVVVNSATGISSGNYTWDGSWFNTMQPTKHNGSYTVQVTPTGFDGMSPEYPTQLTITVHVVHVNDVEMIFTDYGQTTIAHGLPMLFSYQLTEDAYTTLAIYNTNGTSSTADDTLVKSFTDEAPRNSEGQTRDFREHQSWDGTYGGPEDGISASLQYKLVPTGIYRFAIDAYFDHTGLATRDIATTRGWSFAVDKRIVDISTEGISENNPLAKIKYTPTEPANVTIKICKSGTTFSTDVTTGEAIPNPSTNLVKTFTFYQQAAGEQEVTWDGNDENGTASDDGLYLVVITATDVEGNLFFNTSGTDNLFRTTVSIDRTTSQIATDSTAPTVSSTSPSSGSVVTSPFTQVSAVLADESGGSGVDLDNSTISLTDPSSNAVSGTTTNNGTDTLILTVASQSTDGVYTIKVVPKDNTGNTGSDHTATFTLNVTTTSEQTTFQETVYVYPNPAKSGQATFAYTLSRASNVKLEVYSLMGELVYSSSKDDVSGDRTWVWNCKNDGGGDVATGLYLYKLTVKEGSNTYETTKKLIIVR
ncbi:MAG: FlgD immunoglobulin-like domain containing protein [bacterium]